MGQTINPTQFVEGKWPEIKIETKNYRNLEFKRVESGLEHISWDVIRSEDGVKLGTVRYNGTTGKYEFWTVECMLYPTRVMSNIVHFMHQVTKLREIVDG